MTLASAELADLDALDTATAFATAAARRALTRHANQIRAALFAHPAEAREVFQAFVRVLRFTPFGARRSRGVDFEGEGDYGPLLGRAEHPRLMVSPTGFGRGGPQGFAGCSLPDPVALIA
jgi:hypothetical protein